MDYLAHTVYDHPLSLPTPQREQTPLAYIPAESLRWELADDSTPSAYIGGEAQEALQLSDILDDTRNDMPGHADESYDLLLSLMTAEFTCMTMNMHQHNQLLGGAGVVG